MDGVQTTALDRVPIAADGGFGSAIQAACGSDELDHTGRCPHIDRLGGRKAGTCSVAAVDRCSPWSPRDLPSADQLVNILTGGTSGVYYPLGVALSNIYAKAISNAKSSVQATKASVENLNLLQAGRGEIAFALGDSRSGPGLGGERGHRLSRQARQASRRRGDLSQLHPDRSQRRFRHQDAR